MASVSYCCHCFETAGGQGYHRAGERGIRINYPQAKLPTNVDVRIKIQLFFLNKCYLNHWNLCLIFRVLKKLTLTSIVSIQIFFKCGNWFLEVLILLFYKCFSFEITLKGNLVIHFDFGISILLCLLEFGIFHFRLWYLKFMLYWISVLLHFTIFLRHSNLKGIEDLSEF